MAEATGPVSDTQTGPGPGTRLAMLGLGMAAAGPLLFAVIGLIYGFDTGDLGFFLVTGVIALVGVAVVSRRATWAKIVGLVIALVMAVTLWWTIFGLFTPTSVVDFVGGLLVLPGVIVALVGCITALRSRDRTDGAVGGGERRALRIVPGVVAVLALLSLVLTLTARESVDAPADAVPVTMTDFNFEPETLSVEGGSTVVVRNDDPFVHTFTVDALDVAETVTPGSEALITIPSEPGTYVFYCEPHTSDADDPTEDDMAGTLRVG